MKWENIPKLSDLGIRIQLTLVFLICFGVMATAGMQRLRASLLPSFGTMEQASALDDLARVAEGFGTQLSSLELLTLDWAHWDDMYEFVQRPNAAFIESNLSPASMPQISLSLIMILDTAGKRVGYQSISPSTAQERELGLFLPENAEVLQHILSPSNQSSCGFLNTTVAVLLVCWQSILNSEGKGPATGTLVLARDLDARVLTDIAHQTKLMFELHTPPLQESAAEEWRIAVPSFLQETRVGATRLENTLRLDYPLTDLLGKPIASVRMNLPRTLMEQGILVFENTALQLGLIALTTGILLLTGIQFIFIRPLARLQSAVRALCNNKAWKTRLSILRSDEIGLLGQEINELLDVIDVQMDHLESLSLTDPLTGLANRRALELRLQNELQHLKRTGKSLSLLIIDIDCFKQYNDGYGHLAGDQAIQETARVMGCVIQRGQDMASRIGGEEFVALLPNTEEKGARRVAEALQAELAKNPIPHEKSTVADRLTLSIGIATSHTGNESAEQLLDRADKALYIAKEAGRNRFMLADDENHTPAR